MNRRGFLQASTATVLLAAFPLNTAAAIALDPLATILDPRTTVHAKLVRGEWERIFIQCPLGHFRDVVHHHLDAGFELVYLDTRPMRR